MFDIGFLELLICGVIALLVLGPERLPTAARTAGRWVRKTRRVVSQFTSELDRQLKAEELREQLKKAGDVGLEDVERNVRSALDEAKKYEHLKIDDKARVSRSAPTDPNLEQPRPPEQSSPDLPGPDPDSQQSDPSDDSASSDTPDRARENRS